MPVTTQGLDSLLAASAATADFKKAVRDLQGSSRPNDQVQFGYGVPPVKALRAVTKLLEEEPGLAISTVLVQAVSGCSNFTGKLIVNDGEATFEFNWDCAWRARQEGWSDPFGDPDQARAAREFGYQCFERWKKVA